jgi:hypothetical protein
MRRGINKKIVVQVCLDINARHYLKNTAKRVEGGAQKKKTKISLQSYNNQDNVIVA